jgi:hypothetical protein
MLTPHSAQMFVAAKNDTLPAFIAQHPDLGRPGLTLAADALAGTAQSARASSYSV